MPRNTFKPGYDPRRGRNGGRPAKLAEIEDMLDAEHRTAANMREVFERLKRLALDDVVKTFMTRKGELVETSTPPDPAFMRLYLARVLGPERELLSEDDLSELTDEALGEIRTKLRLVK